MTAGWFTYVACSIIGLYLYASARYEDDEWRESDTGDALDVVAVILMFPGTIFFTIIGYLTGKLGDD